MFLSFLNLTPTCGMGQARAKPPVILDIDLETSHPPVGGITDGYLWWIEIFFGDTEAECAEGDAAG